MIKTDDEAASARRWPAPCSRLSLPGAVQQVRGRRAAACRARPLAGKTAVDGKPTAYACLGPQCSLPVTDPDTLLDLLRKQRQAAPQA